MVKPVGHGEVFMRFKFGHLILGLIGKRFNELREHFDFDGLFIQDAEVIDDRATGGRVYQQSQHCTSRHIKEKLCNLKKKKGGGELTISRRHSGNSKLLAAIIANEIPTAPLSPP